jgi:hypothetical protein
MGVDRRLSVTGRQSASALFDNGFDIEWGHLAPVCLCDADMNQLCESVPPRRREDTLTPPLRPIRYPSVLKLSVGGTEIAQAELSTAARAYFALFQRDFQMNIPADGAWIWFKC